jgi:hypothetical protein
MKKNQPQPFFNCTSDVRFALRFALNRRTHSVPPSAFSPYEDAPIET